MPASFLLEHASLKEEMAANFDEDKSNESFLGLQSLSTESQIESTESLAGIYNDFSNFPPCTYASADAVYKLSGMKSDVYKPTVGSG